MRELARYPPCAMLSLDFQGRLNCLSYAYRWMPWEWVRRMSSPWLAVVSKCSFLGYCREGNTLPFGVQPLSEYWQRKSKSHGNLPQKLSKTFKQWRNQEYTKTDGRIELLNGIKSSCGGRWGSGNKDTSNKATWKKPRKTDRQKLSVLCQHFS